MHSGIIKYHKIAANDNLQLKLCKQLWLNHVNNLILSLCFKLAVNELS